VAKPGRKGVPDRKLDPKILIFDVDGVLVDVRETYWRSGLQTLQYLTGKKATWAEFREWKRKPGNNDDWNMVSHWPRRSACPPRMRGAGGVSSRSNWGRDGQPWNVLNEKLLVTRN